MKGHLHPRNAAIIRVINLCGNHANRRVAIAYLTQEKSRVLIKVQLSAGLTAADLLDHLDGTIVDADRWEARSPLEVSLDPCRKREISVDLGALQIASGKRERSHQFVRGGDPAVIAVVRADTVAVLRMHNGGELVGRVGKNL